MSERRGETLTVPAGPGRPGGVVVTAAGIFPFRQIIADRRSVSLAQEELLALRAENEHLEAEVAALETDAEVERLAREQFGLVRPGGDRLRGGRPRGRRRRTAGAGADPGGRASSPGGATSGTSSPGATWSTMDDDAVVAAQIGRPLRSAAVSARRCHLGLPVVIVVPPLLDDGTPFPTRYWLCCPLAPRRVGRLEWAGGVAAMERRAAADPEFGARLEAAHERYAAAARPISKTSPEARPSGGVGGARAGVKCLHAHYADHAAGNDNPVGEAVAAGVDPLDCAEPCVVEGGAGPTNSRWREPR